MHSSRMRTTSSSSHPRGVSTGHPFCYGLLVWWPSGVVPSGVVAFWCGGLLVWWPSGVVAFWCGAFCYGLLAPRRHTRRLPSIRRPPNQKAITEGHNRRPQQKAITEGHTHPGTRHPPGGEPPCCKACWDTTCNACWDTTPLLQGMLGYHLQCMLG